MAKVEIRNLSKSFGQDVKAVDNISLSVEENEFLVVLGPSGGGKSTLLRLIAGLEKEDSGEIFIEGRLVNNIPAKDRNISMVFQNYALYPHMNVHKNLSFALRLQRLPRWEVNRRVSEVAEMLGLSHMLRRKPQALSGGEKQRVALGRAIIRRPKVFLFDEPLSNLDPPLRLQLRAEISKLYKALSATIIYVTHDQVEAMNLGTKIAIMNNGRIHQIGTAHDIYFSPEDKFVAGFIGSPPMNFLEGKLSKKGEGMYFIIRDISLPIKKVKDTFHAYIDKKIILGIRPEEIRLKREEPSAPGEECIEANVDLVEQYGPEILAYLKIGDVSFQAKASSHEKLVLNEKIKIWFNMERAYFFDPVTEKVI